MIACLARLLTRRLGALPLVMGNREIKLSFAHSVAVEKFFFDRIVSYDKLN
jgi:hypothetical protein